MQKALTREDLIYILEHTFRLSKQLDNALQVLEDGLYVQNIDAHQDDTSLHIDERLRGILDKITVNENGDFYYDNHRLGRVSQKEGNAIQELEDGIFVDGVIDEARKHIENGDIHVTKEQKETWDNTLKSAKDYAYELYSNIVIHDFEITTKLPEEGILSTRMYLWTDDPNKPKDVGAVPYIYLGDNWYKLAITNDTLIEMINEKLKDYVHKDDYHEHDNLLVLDSFTETEDGDLLFKGEDIRHIYVSEDEGNAVTLRNGKLYVKDYTEIIRAIQAGAAFSTDVLYNKECADSGLYELEYLIDEFSMLIIDYYYKPNDPEQNPGNAKSVIVDVNTLNHLYEKGIDYMLELGYGASVCNSKISMHKEKLYVNYYHNVCIYRITGIRKSGGEE